MSDEGKKQLPDSGNDLTKVNDSGKPDGSALLQDAMDAMRKLKRKHRVRFEEDPKDFRRYIDKAKSRVLTLQRGPKPDTTISNAAREVAGGASVEKVFQKVYPSLVQQKDKALYAMCLESFRTKVNTRIRRHHLKRRHNKNALRTRSKKKSPPAGQN